jgi:hypothetical protein
MPRILYNGHQYDNIDQMPPDVREAYEKAIKAVGNIFADNDHNGMPDILENAASTPNIQSSTYRMEVNGQVYTSPEELPEKLRPLFEQLAKQTDNNIPEWVQGSGKPAAAVVSENAPDWIKQQSAVQYNSEPVIQVEDGKLSKTIILLVLGVVLVAAFIIAVLLLLK